MAARTTLLVGTRKGAWVFTSDATRRRWNVSKPICFGHIINHFVQDPRKPGHLLIAAKTGHLGPTVYRSLNRGKTWKEASRPPAFPKDSGLVVDHGFWLTPGHASEPGVWWLGTSPSGLFRSGDHGDTWESVDGFNRNPMRVKWVGGPQEAPPDGSRMHSILVDPRDARHMYMGLSGGGFFESLDQGATWTPLNQGCAIDFSPIPNPEYGHDPHCVRLHPLRPDRLYQQNHCGIYRIDRPSNTWERIGRKMPKKVGDIGFVMVLHPRDPDTCWVFPMDGSTVWPRTSPEGKPAVYKTVNAGRSWVRCDKGLPAENSWLTVFRQAMTADDGDPVGVYFGATSGALWGSRDEGVSWKQIAADLPRILSVEVARL